MTGGLSIFDDGDKGQGPQPMKPNNRRCHDCERLMAMHQWIEMRCTLDQEDVTYSYCWVCYYERMCKYVQRMQATYPKDIDAERNLRSTKSRSLTF
jgi:hypothetical protein